MHVLLGLRCRLIVTLRNVRAVIICFWLIGVSSRTMYFWNSSIAFTVFLAFAIFSLATSISSYSKIYLKLRQHQAHVNDLVHQGQPNGGGIELNIARYRKTVSSALWVQLALVTCYVPCFIVIMLTGDMAECLEIHLILLTRFFTAGRSEQNRLLFLNFLISNSEKKTHVTCYSLNENSTLTNMFLVLFQDSFK